MNGGCRGSDEAGGWAGGGKQEKRLCPRAFNLSRETRRAGQLVINILRKTKYET